MGMRGRRRRLKNLVWIGDFSFCDGELGRRTDDLSGRVLGSRFAAGYFICFSFFSLRRRGGEIFGVDGFWNTW